MEEKRPIVMIVDDDALIRETCKEYLEEQGYSVLVAENGRRALQKLKTQDIDAMFLDILMPDKDGIETLREIKKTQPSLRVYVMSGGGSAKLDFFLDIAMKFGADGRLNKPFVPEDMVNLLQAPNRAKASGPVA